MLNDNVKDLLNNSMWDLGTYGADGPNVVPVAFKDITPEGKLVVGDVFLETTLKNIEENGWWAWQGPWMMENWWHI